VSADPDSAEVDQQKQEQLHEFNGKLDDVRVYNYARTAEQVMQDYNQGLAVKLGE